MSDVTPVRVSRNKIRIPVVRTVRYGGRVHTTEVIGSDDPRYAEYDAWLTQQEESDAGG